MTNKVRYYYEDSVPSQCVTYKDCTDYNAVVPDTLIHSMGVPYDFLFHCSERKIMAKIGLAGGEILSTMSPCYKCDRSQKNETQFILIGESPYTGTAASHKIDNDNYAKEIARRIP